MVVLISWLSTDFTGILWPVTPRTAGVCSLHLAYFHTEINYHTMIKFYRRVGSPSPSTATQTYDQSTAVNPMWSSTKRHPKREGMMPKARVAPT